MKLVNVEQDHVNACCKRREIILHWDCDTGSDIDEIYFPAIRIRKVSIYIAYQLSFCTILFM